MNYILDEDGTPVQVPLMAWAAWFETHHQQRIVKHTQWTDKYGDNILVSTVFMGIDHNFSMQGPPVLWETMVFIGGEPDDPRRYTSRADALKGHANIVRKVRRSHGT